MNTDRKHLAKVKMSNELLADFLRATGRDDVVSTAPADLSVRRVYQPPEGINIFFYVIVESSEFPGLLEGQTIPSVDSFLYETKS